MNLLKKLTQNLKKLVGNSSKGDIFISKRPSLRLKIGKFIYQNFQYVNNRVKFIKSLLIEKTNYYYWKDSFKQKFIDFAITSIFVYFSIIFTTSQYNLLRAIGVVLVGILIKSYIEEVRNIFK